MKHNDLKINEIVSDAMHFAKFKTMSLYSDTKNEYPDLIRLRSDKNGDRKVFIAQHLVRMSKQKSTIFGLTKYTGKKYGKGYVTQCEWNHGHLLRLVDSLSVSSFTNFKYNSFGIIRDRHRKMNDYQIVSYALHFEQHKLFVDDGCYTDLIRLKRDKNGDRKVFIAQHLVRMSKQKSTIFGLTKYTGKKYGKGYVTQCEWNRSALTALLASVD